MKTLKSVRAAVLHVNGAKYESTSPTMRIARFASEEMGIPLIHDAASALYFAKKRFDVLFVKYGLLKFSDHREESVQIHQHAGAIINLENDYTFKPDKRFGLMPKQGYAKWGTVNWDVGRSADKYVNWNVLTWLPPAAWSKALPLAQPVNTGLLYYGAHRDGRVPYFKKYLACAPYPVTISTYRGGKRFRETCGARVSIISAFRKPEAPAQWPMTVYIEDERSHDLYCSPANRFYECVQMGLAQAIDANSANTLVQAGVPRVDDFVVDSQKDLADMLKRAQWAQQAQRKHWHRDYTAELRSQLRAACRGAFGAKCGM